jgi:adenine-specific DNA methylase
MLSTSMNPEAGRLLFPTTRYQGSKRKLLGWIHGQVRRLEFDTVLDALGGTGAVSYLFKGMGKRVTYNDVLASNHQVGLALVENDARRLSDATIERVVRPESSNGHGDFIERTFGGVYFTDEENRWLDRACGAVASIRNRYERAVAWYALFQSCLAKRPYNLFHRKNLYMRTACVSRTFGNKATWDRPFVEHFRRHAASANEAIFPGGQPCRALNLDAASVPGEFDLVYIDPPYVSSRNVGVDYGHFYHFLEGMTDYDGWPERIDFTRKHRPLRLEPNPWSDKRTNNRAFQELFERFADSTLVVSYRSDGCPGPVELVKLLKKVKRNVRVAEYERYQYALSKNRASKELLFIAT